MRCWCARKNVLSKSTYSASFVFWPLSLARSYHIHPTEDYFLVTEAASFKGCLFCFLLGTCKRKSLSQSEYTKAHWMCLRELPCSLTDRQTYSPQHFARPHPAWKNIQSEGPAFSKLQKKLTWRKQLLSQNTVMYSNRVRYYHNLGDKVTKELSHHCCAALLKISLLRSTTLITAQENQVSSDTFPITLFLGPWKNRVNQSVLLVSHSFYLCL